MPTMGETLNKRLRLTRLAGATQDAVLNLLVASGVLRDKIDSVFGAEGLTGPQYNVLRILRGAQPGGFARCEIAQRLVERAPDVTRLIDRLERQGLVARDRSSEDRRRSVTRITDKGLQLIDRMEPAMNALDRWLEERLSLRDRNELSRILELLYSNED